MKNAQKLLYGKKGDSYYSPILLIVSFAVLVMIFSTLVIGQYRLARDFDMGREQLAILAAHSTAEKALTYIDNSAGIALEKSIYTYSMNGLNRLGSNCPAGYWTKGEIDSSKNCEVTLKPCYPDSSSIGDGLESVFRPEFTPPLSKSGLTFGNSAVAIPEDYYFKAGQASGKTEIIGKAKELIVITASAASPLRYFINGSFRESASPDIIADGAAMSAVASQLAQKPEKKARELVAAADGKNGLDWNEQFQYVKDSKTCSYPVGSCACCITSCDNICEPDENGKNVCKRQCFEIPADDGVKKRFVPYDAFEIPMTVKPIDSSSPTGYRRVFVGESGKAVQKEVAYRFSLNWIDAHPEEAEDKCSCPGSSHDC